MLSFLRLYMFHYCTVYVTVLYRQTCFSVYVYHNIIILYMC